MRTNNRSKTTIVTKNLASTLMKNDIITTPCEKVLFILNQAKNFISNITKNQSKLIQNLEWCIKIITSHSLYSYEIKEKEAISKISQENPAFKQLVDFVSEYNEKVIKMNRKYNYILTDKLLQKSSTQLNKRRIERKNSFVGKDSNISKLLNMEESVNLNNNFENMNNNNDKDKDKEKPLNRKKTVRNSNCGTKFKFNTIENKTNYNNYIKTEKKNPFEEAGIKKRMSLKKGKRPIINVDEQKIKDQTFKNISNSLGNSSLKINKSNDFGQKNHKNSNSKIKSKKNEQNGLFCFAQKEVNKKNYPTVQTISININDENEDEDDNENLIRGRFNSFNSNNISLNNSIGFSNNNSTNNTTTTNNSINTSKESSKIQFAKKAAKSKSRKNIPQFKDYSYMKYLNKLIHEGYDISKSITEKTFNIFELKDLIGYNNVMPMIGRTILENLGLIDEEIINVSKLDKFLVSVSNQYKKDSLYHNSMHGSDVTQSVYTFFIHSSAEKIAKTNVLDLLSIIIASLGHDIAHPGLTNTFHINDSTEIAITYNDISVLENFHASTLFRTLRKTENNIFDKLTTIDYKMIRKRMISEILATDMANHGKVISLIKSKLSLNENNEYKFNLLSGNEQTRIEEQQSLLDFFIHLADLAHNSRLFDISIKWVELLSEEFWKQGDLEKDLNLPVSFLCDRDDINIPKSQIGFISGFIIPTFESLITIFPTLRFTLDNAKNNLKEWQKLMEQGRKRGWTPEKINTNKKRKLNPFLSKSIRNGKNFFKDFPSLNDLQKKKEKNEEKAKNESNLLKRDEYLNTKMKNSRNNSNSFNHNNKNMINMSYNIIKKNRKFIDINNDDIGMNNKTFIKNKIIKMPTHQPMKSVTFKKSILKINKDKSNNEKKNKTIKFKNEDKDNMIKNTKMIINNQLNDKKV